VKRKVKTAIVVVVLLVGGLWFYRVQCAASLPRFPLAEGGEFRVFKICYGGQDDHRLEGPPGSLMRVWRCLPQALQRVIPYHPENEVHGLSPFSGHMALSIWWAVVEPTTKEPVLGPSGDVIMTVDSGEQTNLDWPDPWDPGYRQIFVDEPPRNSRKLHFLVPVEDETVEFTIANPAYAP
jgi:hypothetical protein